jgi:hypothetical protein
VWATDIDVLPADRVERRQTAEGAGHLVVRSPGNPMHWWGNFLIFDEPPQAGDGPRWEAAFAAAFPRPATGRWPATRPTEARVRRPPSSSAEGMS